MIAGSHSIDCEVDVFRDVAPCSLVEIYRHFKPPAVSIIRAIKKVMTHRPDDGGRGEEISTRRLDKTEY